MWWAKRVLSIGVLLLGSLPSLLSMGVGLHLVADPHHPDHRVRDAESPVVSGEASETRRSDGNVGTPGHAHVVFKVAKFLKRPTGCVAVNPATTSDAAAVPPAEAPNGGVSRHGASTPLFTSHCALLL